MLREFSSIFTVPHKQKGLRLKEKKEKNPLLHHRPLDDRMKYCTKKPFGGGGEVFPTEAERVDLSFIYPLIPPVATLIKQSRCVAGVATLMGADDQS